MRRWGTFLTLIVLWYTLSSALSLVYFFYPYGLLAALSHRLNNFNLTLIMGTSARRKSVYKQFSNQVASFHLQKKQQK